MVPDTSLSLREGAVVSWPGAWQGKNLRRHRLRAGHRHRPAVARAAPRRAGVGALHRRAADRAGRAPRRARRHDGPRLPGHVLERAAQPAAHPRRLAERDHADQGDALHAQRDLPALRRGRADRGRARGLVRGSVDRGGQRAGAHRGGRAAARGARRRRPRRVHGGAGAPVRRPAGPGRGAPRPRARVPQPGPQLDHALARRGAAPADRDPAPLGALRRRLRARRALGRAAPGGRGAAARRAGPDQGLGQHAVRRRARPRRRPSGRLGGRHRSRRRRGRRPGPVLRAGRRSGGGRGVRDGAAPLRPGAAGRRARPRAARPAGLAAPARRLAPQPASGLGRRAAAGADRGDRGLGLRQVHPGHPGARGGGAPAPRSGPRRAGRRRTWRSTSRTPRASTRSTGWCAWTSGRSVARRAPTSRRTPGCSTRCAGSSRRPTRRAGAGTASAGSRSTWPRGAARPARARGSSPWSCSSCPAATPPARPATGPATTRRRSR